MGPPGFAEGIDEKQSPPVLLLGPRPAGRVGLARGAALVTHRYPHQVVAVVQLAHYVCARRVHDGVGDQLGDHQGRAVARVLAHRPAYQPGPRQASGLCGGTRMCGQLETEPALGSGPGGADSGGTEAGRACGGVCS